MPRRRAARRIISLNTAGEALTIRFAPRAARTMDHRLRAFVSMTSIVLFLPRNRRARVMSRSPHQTVCPWRVSRWASSEPVPPAPRTKMRIGAPLYHNRCEEEERPAWVVLKVTESEVERGVMLLRQQ